MTKKQIAQAERVIAQKTVQLSTKSFNHDCGVAAARGSFYERWNAKNKQIRPS